MMPEREDNPYECRIERTLRQRRVARLFATDEYEHA